jgi:hypothetical protein
MAKRSLPKIRTAATAAEPRDPALIERAAARVTPAESVSIPAPMVRMWRGYLEGACVDALKAIVAVEGLSDDANGAEHIAREKVGLELSSDGKYEHVELAKERARGSLRAIADILLLIEEDIGDVFRSEREAS